MTQYTLNARYIKGTGSIEKGQYENGSLALQFFMEGELDTLTVNLIAYGLVAPEGHVYVKNYNEGEGLAQALSDAGVAESVGTVTYGPYDTTATLMKVVI